MRTDWESLAERAVEANLFAEPAFVLTACETLAGGERARAALIWDDHRACDPRHRLRGLFLLAGGRFGGPFASARTWRPLHSASGIPLIDRDCTDAVLAAFLDLLVAEGASTAGAIFPMAAADGPFARALRRFAAATGREVVGFDAHDRAVLHSGVSGEAALTGALSGKKLKELRRQLRRLGDIGVVRVASDHDPCAIRRSVEIFLAIEASGWKSRRGTALLQDAAVAHLVRSVTRDLARNGRCRVDTLWAADTPVAAAITVESGNRGWFWKIAYDEAFARYSPGVQIAMHVTQAQLERGTIAMTDSGAIANHPMIDHIWRDRMPVADLFVPIRTGASLGARLAIAREATRRRIRAGAKSTYRKVMKGKVS